MTVMGITPQGLLFTGSVLALFGWGLFLGLMGAFAPAPPNTDGTHVPGAAGTYDARYRTPGREAA